jgi:hypothetical protein
VALGVVSGAEQVLDGVGFVRDPNIPVGSAQAPGASAGSPPPGGRGTVKITMKITTPAWSLLGGWAMLSP